MARGAITLMCRHSWRIRALEIPPPHCGLSETRCERKVHATGSPHAGPVKARVELSEHDVSAAELAAAEWWWLWWLGSVCAGGQAPGTGRRVCKETRKKRGRPLSPIAIAGRTIARSFWGRAWCDNLETYSDFENRLPRGQRYVCNGSVIDLQIEPGRVTALVSGSEVFEVNVAIERLPPNAWRAIQHDCARSIASLIDLLQGRFDRGVMERLSRTGDGLFPQPAEIKMPCSCPDYATLCKHVAAVLYGVGARLDHAPELLFTLRDVDHLEQIGEAAAAENLDRALAGDSAAGIDTGDLGELFGIELDNAGAAAPVPQPGRRVAQRP